ncbi:MAG: TerC family protein [Melioribacteraceae bacterium]|nr:TerC family protein [Melioribacteraceae bacterium]MDD3558868.1 TerC family protein [Melioribacteraceae bacterium]
MLILWSGFIVLILILLLLDLGVFHKKDSIISVKSAMLWTIFWIVLALLFSVFIYFAYENNWYDIKNVAGTIYSGKDAVIKYITGYVIEKSLSLDNIFVIAIIFAYFKIPAEYQHRVLFWGILGALVLRGVMILLGTVLIQSFEWMIYVFGALLIYTAAKMMFNHEEGFNPSESRIFRYIKTKYPIAEDYHGHNFFVIINGKKHATIMLLALALIESADLLFAVDSIPAIFAITIDPFIVFTSNIFAILGLRSLYFALAAMIRKFYYLKTSLVIILFYVGIKMLISKIIHISPIISLAIILVVISGGIIFSINRTRKLQENNLDQ